MERCEGAGLRLILRMRCGSRRIKKKKKERDESLRLHSFEVPALLNLKEVRKPISITNSRSFFLGGVGWGVREEKKQVVSNGSKAKRGREKERE